MTEKQPVLMTPEDEPAVRLLAFSAALLAITVRENTRVGHTDAGGVFQGIETRAACLSEARAIADAIVAEGKRLQSGES